jgi:hypothetical protein
MSIVLKNILARSGRREMDPVALQAIAMQAWILRGIRGVAGVGFFILAVTSI